MTQTCSNCGKENEDEATTCSGCDTPLGLEGPEALLGKTVLNSYELTHVLGEGGMAVVYRGRNRLTDQVVAVKTLPPELAVYSEVKARFINEARTLAKLEHPNIVHLINFAEDLGRLCLVMQYADGETVEDKVDAYGRVSAEEVVRFTMETLKALSHAHNEGVVHRDIKPSNIIIRPDGTVKVMDFGIAKITRSTKLTQTGQTMGTVRYMSPEQVRGKGIDERSDLYSLGVTMYEAVVGHTPFDGETHFAIMNAHLQKQATPPIEAGADISTKLETVIMKALAKKPEHRYQNADEMSAALKRCPEAAALRKAASSVTIPAARTGKTTVTGAAVSMGRRGWILAAVAGVAVLAGAAVFLILRPTPESDDSEGRRKKRRNIATRRVPKDPLAQSRKLWETTMHPKLRAVDLKVKWSATRTFHKPLYLKVYNQKPADADRLAKVYENCLDLYPKLLASERISEPVVPRPLVICLVAEKVLNDKTLWPGEAQTDARYFPLPVATLFVAQEKGFENASLLFGIAGHLCPPRLSGPECQRLGELFIKYYSERSPK